MRIFEYWIGQQWSLVEYWMKFKFTNERWCQPLVWIYDWMCLFTYWRTFRLIRYCTSANKYSYYVIGDDQTIGKLKLSLRQMCFVLTVWIWMVKSAWAPMRLSAFEYVRNHFNRKIWTAGNAKTNNGLKVFIEKSNLFFTLGISPDDLDIYWGKHDWQTYMVWVGKNFVQLEKILTIQRAECS